MLFVSRKCPHSIQLMKQFPNLPSTIGSVDVHDPRALKHLQAYRISSVPCLLVLDRQGNARIFTKRTEIASILMSASGSGGAAAAQTAVQKGKGKPKVEMKDGVDPDGPFPEVDDNTGSGLCGFDGCAIGELTDVADSYQSPFSSTNSNEKALNAPADQRPNGQFQGPVQPQRPLVPAGFNPNPKQNDPISSDDMSRRLDELHRVRDNYDKSLEARNRNQYAMNMAIRN